MFLEKISDHESKLVNDHNMKIEMWDRSLNKYLESVLRCFRWYFIAKR